MKHLIMAEVPADKFFEDDDSVDYRYCSKFASFVHKDACEFMIHLSSNRDERFDYELSAMKEFGCTEGFMEALKTARDSGATWAMLYR